MRTSHPDYERHGISRARYAELRAYCMQYPQWKQEASSLLGVGAQQYSPMPHGSGTSDPVECAAERREQLLAKIEHVESTAQAIDNGRWYRALLLNVCDGIGLDSIDPAVLPTSNRNAFFIARRAFYIALHESKSKI